MSHSFEHKICDKMFTIRKFLTREIKNYQSSMIKTLGFRDAKKLNKKNIITKWEKDSTLDC